MAAFTHVSSHSIHIEIMLIINISAEYQAHRIQDKTVTFIFRNYFIGIHIFTLVSPLDDKESHIFILNSQSLDCLLRMPSASRGFGLAWFRRAKIFTNCRLECMICFLIMVTFNKIGQHYFWMNITLALSGFTKNVLMLHTFNSVG